MISGARVHARRRHRPGRRGIRGLPVRTELDFQCGCRCAVHDDLTKIVAAAMGKECRTVHLDPRNEVKIAFSDHSEAEAVFGKWEKMSLEVGVRAMAE